MATEKHLLQCIDLLTTRRLEELRPLEREQVIEIRAILASPQLVGIGLGERPFGERPGGTLAIRFYVFNKKAPASARLLDLVPRALSTGLSQEASAVDIVELGDPSLQDALQTSSLQGDPSEAPPTSGSWFPPAVQPGYGIKHYRGPLGTFGAVVKDPEGRPFALSNCHVLALGGAASRGDEIDYPGLSGPMGKLHRFIPLVGGGGYANHADAAIASFSERALSRLDPRLRTVGTLPGREVDPSRGMSVTKIGLDGRASVSSIVDVNFRAVFTSGDQRFGFLDQILCWPRFSEDGDSGALVLEKNTRRAVGLNFAATADTRGSVCCPIAQTLEALEVALWAS